MPHSRNSRRTTHEQAQVLQNRALRIILDYPVYVPRRYLHKDIKIPPLHERIRELSENFHGQLNLHVNPTIRVQTDTDPGTHRHPAHSTNIQELS
ncbi:hypothetical protein TNCT_685231 [Trichonephila clavata]|uniref:Uncharacterized protein n=1 Tax=Trichonephila clavata TaxID=2740835 RepID=A0A8X6FKF9_TRICU|nr:hypothetical protein TNCT_707331 [Trichonephila clavata]GFR21405.1 hypothetical protein TNCT_685231 [Trichonephila clavata]